MENGFIFFEVFFWIGPGAKFLASFAQRIQPRRILRGILLPQFFSETLCERGTFSVRGDGNLQIAALDDGAVVEMAVGDVVHGVAENTADFGGLKDCGVYRLNGSRGDNQSSVLQIGRSEFLRRPLNFAGFYPGGNLRINLRSDDPHASVSLEEARDFAGCDVAASDDHDRSTLQLHEYGKEAHDLFRPLPFHAVRHRAQRHIALDGADEGAGQQRAQFVVSMATKKLAQVFVFFALGVEAFEQPFNGVGHGVRRAPVANWTRDGRELAHATADAEVVGVDHFAVLLNFLAFDADVRDPMLAATVWASGDVQLELLFEGGQALFEFLG